MTSIIFDLVVFEHIAISSVVFFLKETNSSEIRFFLPDREMHFQMSQERMSRQRITKRRWRNAA